MTDFFNKIVRIQGNSMEPVLHDGDIAFCSVEEPYSIGDIVVFSYKYAGIEKMLSHRIIDKDSACFLCKGDNAFRMEKIEGNAILGKITSVIRNGKRISIEMPQKAIKEFCDLSKRCGEEWQCGDVELAQATGKRCCVNMLKMCLAMENREKNDTSI